MKIIKYLALLALICAGCATESGEPVEAKPPTLPPSFPAPPPLPGDK